MISNKTVATLFLITLNLQLAISTSLRGISTSSSSSKSVPIKGRRHATGTKKNVLKDTNNTTNDVEVPKTGTDNMDTLKEQSVPQTIKEFEELISQEKYYDLIKLGEKMSDEKFMMQICPVIQTLEQYAGLADYLEGRKMVVSFYMHGNIEVVKGAVVRSKIYDNNSDYYVEGGDLETALLSAIKEDKHDRVIELLNVRQEVTANTDKQLKEAREMTSFERFMAKFLRNLARWDDEMALKRFLTFRVDELRNKCPDALDALCEELVFYLKINITLPSLRKLIIDLVGQPSLLTPVAFAKGFLRLATDGDRSKFIKYAWDEAIREGLKEEYLFGGEHLWRVMKKKRPTQFTGDFPSTTAKLAAVIAHFPKKRQKEEQWVKEIMAVVESVIDDIFPKVLVKIILDYTLPQTHFMARRPKH